MLETEPPHNMSLSRAERLVVGANSGQRLCNEVGLAGNKPNVAITIHPDVNLGLGQHIIGQTEDSRDSHNGATLHRADWDRVITNQGSVDCVAQSTRVGAVFQTPIEEMREHLGVLKLGQDGPLDGLQQKWAKPGEQSSGPSPAHMLTSVVGSSDSPTISDPQVPVSACSAQDVFRFPIGFKQSWEENAQREGKSPKKGREDVRLSETNSKLLLAELFHPGVINSRKSGLRRKITKRQRSRKGGVVESPVPHDDDSLVTSQAKEAGQSMPPTSP